MKLSYKNKRDQKNKLLWFKAYELNFEIVEEAKKILFENIQIDNYPFFKINKLYVSYLEKTLFYKFLDISHKIIIYNFDNKKKKNKIILTSSEYIPVDLLNQSLIKLNLNFIIKNTFNNIIKNIFKNFFIFFIEKFYKKIFFKKKNLIKENCKNKNINIGVNYSDGIDENKRSDLFFYNKDKLKKNIIIYFEYPSLKTKHTSKIKLNEKLNNLSIRSIDLWKWKQSKIYYEFKRKTEKRNKINIWLYFEILKLNRQLNYWQNFFLDYNIKIHLDPSEYGNTNIAKQIVIENINGLSIGKLRSYPTNLKGIFYQYYPNDVFFTWGNDSAKKIKKTKNNIKNVILSGYPYNINENNLADYINKNFNNKIKYKLLLIDNNYGENLSTSQNIYTNDIATFYTKLLDLCKQSPNVGLIIKPKRYNEFQKIKKIQSLVDDLINKKKCIVIKNAYQTQTISYSIHSDISIGIGVFASSAFLESIIYKKGIYYDYGNAYLEDDILEKGRNEIIFDNLNLLIEKLKFNIENNFINKDFGNWDNYINNIEKFRDKLGNKRIGEYINDVKEKLDNNNSVEKSIELANQKYIKKWY